VEQSAEKAGVTPLAFADDVSGRFQELCTLYDFTPDRFIRTTEANHAAAAQALWRKLVESGDIYLGAYEGWYAVRDEAFYTESELVDGKAPTGADVEWVAEESYFFRLSRWREPLEKHIRENPDFIRPTSRANEVLSFMREGLKDLSVSRTTFSWGIAVPRDASETAPSATPSATPRATVLEAAPPEGFVWGYDSSQPAAAPGAADVPSEGGAKKASEAHIMYVWLDALTNYLTGVGFPDDADPSFQRFWPASLHMVGKDILRFHAIYWPAFLMAAGLPLPKHIFAHGWWTKDGEKMSKSLGNVIDPVQLVEQYGADPVRYFMVRSPPGLRVEKQSR
jgi:methionyl-tRNA synthetase